MPFQYRFNQNIDLFVKGRIAEEDSARQQRTAIEILKRLDSQPGLILADEVGMGKTFVALAVAISVLLEDKQKRPVVVMVPSSLKEKWPKDLNIFKERCLPKKLADKLKFGFSDKAVDFLKFLDDPIEKKKSIIFLTHGAMSRGLTDGWVKLAIIRRAFFKRKGTSQLKTAFSRIAGDLLRLKWASNGKEEMWLELIEKHPSKWLKVLQKYNVDPENDNNPETDDDPVPASIVEVLENMGTENFEELYQSLKNIPLRKSSQLDKRIKNTKEVLNRELKEIYSKSLSSLKIKFPLLILDEAHHLKNAKTQLASLFSNEDSMADANEYSQGALANVFERMLFLTATPFQLGHHELCSVLERFGGIFWSNRSNGLSKENYQHELNSLRDRLDRTQERALRFENAWGKLKPGEFDLTRTDFLNEISEGNNGLGDISEKYRQLFQSVKESEELLKKYVIRHNKDKFLPAEFKHITRRNRVNGKNIIEKDVKGERDGILLSEDSLLPFLLAARASILNATARPVFAEGLASSYEAFLRTREAKEFTDDDDEVIQVECHENWYLENIEQAIRANSKRNNNLVHPKIRATVNKAVDLWMQGEKVLIFCHYIATGKALRQYISQELQRRINEIASKKLGCRLDEVDKRLDNIGERFSSKDTQFMIAFQNEFDEMLKDYHAILPERERIFDIIKRYVRTPSFLVRFFPIEDKERFSEKTFLKAMDSKDSSGISLRNTILEFLNFLEKKCGNDERIRYIESLHAIQTGSILTDNVKSYYSQDEIQGENAARLIPNVRLVNGATKSDTRQNLMLTFNTPFYPDILISSSVLAEGVDLHLNCRFIIHHDLCWNPSTLEQRTGRIDRISAKAEKCGKPIVVYIPFIAETQDEKMFKVVMDREKWFKIVMGEKYKTDVKTTDKIAERIPLPDSIAEMLTFDLSVPDD
ncbi:MAG: DEAD/DEAH box helicase [Bacteroidetes bacterium]|nr:DEAD/DEAH box helicase [Bacteroidota bacterium]